MGSPTERMLANMSLGEPANSWFLGQGAVPSSLTSPVLCNLWVQQAWRWKPENSWSKDGKREGTWPATLLNRELCHLTQPRGTVSWDCRHEAADPSPPNHLCEVPSHGLKKLSAQLEKYFWPPYLSDRSVFQAGSLNVCTVSMPFKRRGAVQWLEAECRAGLFPWQYLL